MVRVECGCNHNRGRGWPGWLYHTAVPRRRWRWGKRAEEQWQYRGCLESRWEGGVQTLRSSCRRVYAMGACQRCRWPSVTSSESLTLGRRSEGSGGHPDGRKLGVRKGLQCSSALWLFGSTLGHLHVPRCLQLYSPQTHDSKTCSQHRALFQCVP